MLEISHWSGRFGNNILQIVRCIHFAHIHGHCVIKMPQHKYLLDTQIHISDISDNSLYVNNTFFSLKSLGLSDPSSATLRKYAHQYILPILKLKPTTISTSLVLHCRGGDIFNSNPHTAYVQPPLSYYENIIIKYDSAILIYEDTTNPCVPILLQNSKVIGQSSTFEHDFSVLLSAKVIVGCFSTFTYAAYLLSTNLKRIYFPDYFVSTLPQAPYDIDFVSIELPNYIKPGEWHNSKEQRNIMITYT